jgi:hypothetical protein
VQQIDKLSTYMQQLPAQRAQAIGRHGASTVFACALLALCSVAVWPVAAQSAGDDGESADQQVLRSWQLQTGQAPAIGRGQNPASSEAALSRLDTRGQVSLDAYDTQVDMASGNPALSPLRSGQYGKLVFQGDVRSTSASQDVNYAQGVLTSTNDRSVLARYANQINSLQVGRTGVGYQLAFGDVVAGYSSLGSNLGLRGALGSKELDAVQLSGYVGTVAESWEALASRDTLDGQPARTRLLRDVVGAKVDYKLSSAVKTYATLQSYHDRSGSATVTTAPLSGRIVSLGGSYTEGGLLLSTELAHATKKDDNAGTRVSDNAFIVDASYRLDNLGLRLGYHNLGENFASLAQTAAPGVRETYVGGDWQINPQWQWSSDLRTSTTRLPATSFFAAQSTSLDSWNNRLAFSPQDIAGLSLSLSDIRSRGKDFQANPSRNDSRQWSAAYANALWNTSLNLGTSRTRNPQFAVADSNSQQWQWALGRHWNNASANLAPSWSLSLQGNLGGQVQKLLASGNQSRGTNIGLSLNGFSNTWGTLGIGWQQQTNTQPTPGMAKLRSQALQLDWAKTIGVSWALKAYAKFDRRNHGDLLLQVDEQTVGMQGALKW